MSSFSVAFLRLATAMMIAAVASPAAAQCEAGAWVEGSAALVEALRASLRERGVPVLEDPTCASRAAVSVEVAMSERGLIRVVLLGSEGASAVRDVDRMTTAALLVESWAQATELDLLEPRRAESAPVATSVEARDEAGVPAAPRARASVLDEPALPPAPSPAIATINAAAIASFGNEDSSWFGALLGVCAAVGPTCIGGSVWYLSDSGLSDAPSESGQRTYLAGNLDLALPFRVAPGFVLTPAVALGLAWLDVVVLSPGPPIVTDALRALGTGSFAAAVALVDWLSLELRVAATWSPLARQSAWSDEGSSIDPDPVFLGSVMLGVRAEIR